MKKSLWIWAMLLFGYTAFAQNSNTHLNHYINVKNALVNGDSKTATQTINTFYQSLKGDKDLAQQNELLRATEKLSKANGIEKQRAVFNDVSIAMWKLVKSAENVKQAVYYQYCPMKKGYWLSLEKEIKNPYYGSSMLACGKIAETKS